jgi:hypothetical protein
VGISPHFSGAKDGLSTRVQVGRIVDPSYGNTDCLRRANRAPSPIGGMTTPARPSVGWVMTANRVTPRLAVAGVVARIHPKFYTENKLSRRGGP